MFDSERKSTRAMDVFILAGQSNMAGRGGVQRKDGTKMFGGPQSEKDGRIQRFSRAGSWEIAEEPLHRDIDTK
jgi:hypothetical protein